ncbi:hypothetical protein [Cyanobium sp. ATX 6F1]|uniref:hypothetical protein n=1 Tax=unclassified Cyanobium TaxID=2627006 RepID=UPI0020CFD032|nr:hypothetical protein [Cyanobium sp. ATX 6F1]MCP9915870.1 hypothetical protein [Cyanobium sp. ATX 6F1]
MKVVIRSYSGKGAKETFDALEQQSADVERLLRSVKGFVSYTLAHTEHGGLSVTVCQDQAGIDESLLKAKDYIARNIPDTGASAPEVTVGHVILQLT